MSEEAQEQPASCSSSGGESTSTQGERLDDYFVRHKLSKHDTLAGLAVKYNVTVSDIKRANGLLADSAMFAKDTLLIPTRPLPVGPEYSTWAGMIVTHYGRLGGSAGDEATPSESADMHAAHFSQTRAMRQLRGYYSTGPSRTQSPQYGSDDSDRHHLFAGGWGSPSRRGAGPQQVELMERSAPAAAATYIEDRLRRRGRGDSQQDDLPASSSQVLADGEEGGSGAGSSSSGARGAGPGGDAGHFAMLQHRPALFGSEGAALVSAGGRQLTQWKESLLKKLKKVASQPALVPPPGASTSLQQLGQAAVASAPGGGSAAAGDSANSRTLPERPGVRQRTSGGGGPKAD